MFNEDMDMTFKLLKRSAYAQVEEEVFQLNDYVENNYVEDYMAALEAIYKKHGWSADEFQTEFQLQQRKRLPLEIQQQIANVLATLPK